MTTTRRGILAGFAACASLAPGRARPQAADDRRRDLVDGLRRAYGLPGLSVALATDGEVVFAAGSGVADTAAGEPVSGRSLFRIASCSKPITALALLQAASTGGAGRAELDRQVLGGGGLLAGLSISNMREGWDRITVRQLLTHTAGCPANDGRDPMFARALRGLSDARFIEAVVTTRCLNRDAPGAEVCPEPRPGLGYAYSNFGYFLLGAVLGQAGLDRGTGGDRVGEEGVAGPYGRFVQETVLGPRGIRGMRLARDGVRLPGEVAYYGEDGQDPYGFDIARMAAHGGWVATAPDLALFAATAPRGLPGEVERRMATPTPQSLAAGRPYGEGWQLGGRPPYNLWHTGSLPGTAAIVWRRPDGRAYAALTNLRTRRKVAGRGLLGALDRLGYRLFDV